MLERLNYRHNKQYESALPEGLINGQATGAVSSFRYGLFGFGWCGCEIIAVYNLLKMLGRPEPLCEIEREIYRYGSVLCGFFGTNVYVLAHYFRRHAVPVHSTYDKKVFLTATPRGKYGVVSFWTGRVLASSIHTVAYRVRGDGKIVIYNRYNSRDCEHEYADIDEAFGKYAFLAAHMM